MIKIVTLPLRPIARSHSIVLATARTDKEQERRRNSQHPLYSLNSTTIHYFPSCIYLFIYTSRRGYRRHRTYSVSAPANAALPRVSTDAAQHKVYIYVFEDYRSI